MKSAPLESPVFIGDFGGWSCTLHAPNRSPDAPNTIIEFSPEDQVLTVGANADLGELVAEIKRSGFTIPYDTEDFDWMHSGFLPRHPTVGDAAALGLWGPLHAQHGGWRDWLLGCRMQLASGIRIKSGSKAVKSVAGYDLHKLMIGTRHTLAVLTELTLRVCPVRSLQLSAASIRKIAPEAFYAHRVLAADFQRAIDLVEPLAVDPKGCALWSVQPLPEDFGEHESVGHGFGPGNLPTLRQESRDHFALLKAKLDPNRFLNPGALGGAS